MDKEVLKDLTYGMYIIGTKEENKYYGCVVNTAVQITSKNPMIAISLNKENETNKVIKRTKKVSIMVIHEKAPKELITTFGYQSSKEVDKYKDFSYDEIEDTPILKDGICSYMIATIKDVIDCDTHDIFLCEVRTSKKVNQEYPMTYGYYQEVLKGRSPQNAPTFVEETQVGEKPIYQCVICGHIYDDNKEPIPFEKLPDSWVCPTCKVAKRMFKRIN